MSIRQSAREAGIKGAQSSHATNFAFSVDITNNMHYYASTICTIVRAGDAKMLQEQQPTAENILSETPKSGSEQLLSTLGHRVREVRERRGMTRKLVARDSGVSERHLAQLEVGEANVSIA